MTNEQHNAITGVIKALCRIPAIGYENKCLLLGSINTLMGLIKEETDDGDIHPEQ